MTWKITNPSLGFPPIAERIAQSDDYIEPPPYGTVVQAFHDSLGAGEFIFLKGVLSTVPKSWVVYNPADWTTGLVVADARGPVAVAMATAIGSYAGWYQRSGMVSAKASTSFADNGNVYATATSGVVDDAAVAGDLITGARGAGAEVSAFGYANFELDRPFINDRVGTIPGSGSSVNNG